mgnify:FL=1
MKIAKYDLEALSNIANQQGYSVEKKRKLCGQYLKDAGVTKVHGKGYYADKSAYLLGKYGNINGTPTEEQRVNKFTRKRSFTRKSSKPIEYNHKATR